MSARRGLDDRCIDANGQIRAKNGTTLIETLRQTYGDSFAAGARSDMKLDTLLERTGFDSLSQYRNAGTPPVPPKQS